MSNQMIRKRVDALEQAAAQGYSIDAENDMVMKAAPALSLAIEPPPHYAAEVAAYMINEKYQPWLNEVGRQPIAQQDRLAELQKQVAEAHERRTPLDVAFSEVVRSRGTTPSVKNLWPSSRPLGVTKSSSISSGKHRERILHTRHLRRLYPQPPLPYHDCRQCLHLWQWNKIPLRYVSNENDPLREQGKPLYPPLHKSQVPLFWQ